MSKASGEWPEQVETGSKTGQRQGGGGGSCEDGDKDVALTGPFWMSTWRLHVSTYEPMAIMTDTTPSTIPPQSHNLSAPGKAPSAVSVCSALRSRASTVLTIKSATIASTPGIYTILYPPARWRGRVHTRMGTCDAHATSTGPAIGSQPPFGGGGAGVACGPSNGHQSFVGSEKSGRSGILGIPGQLSELCEGAGVLCGVCVPFAGACPHLQGSP
jgi:hypothetical protein